jgi:hypothetical protein
VGRILRCPSSPPIESVRNRLAGIEHERARRLAKPSHPARRWIATEAGMIILTEPIFAAIFGQLLMGDRLSGLLVV